MAYHYIDSGLDNIYLENGYTVHKTSYGEGISIQDAEGLHRAIGKRLISQRYPLNGAEFRFLRMEMELTQNALAGLIGSTEQNVRRWETAKKKDVQGPADRMLRVLYNEYVGGDGSVRRMVDRLAELDMVDRTKVCLRETDQGWRDSILY